MHRKQRHFWIAAGVIAVPCIAAMLLSWFSSRIGSDPFEQGQLWFSAAAFVASGWSVMALVWTLQEQRKLTQNQSRAYLRENAACLAADSMKGGANLQIEIENFGNTPAFDIAFDGELRFRQDGPSDPPVPWKKILVHAELALLPPGQIADLYCNTDDLNALRELTQHADAGSHGRRYGAVIHTADDLPARLEVEGVISFADAYGEQRHKIPAHYWAELCRQDSVVLMPINRSVSRRADSRE